MNSTRSMWALLIMAGLCLGDAVRSEGDLAPGASRDEVYAELGEPRSYLRFDATEIVFYERGRVELEEGVATVVNLISQAEADALRQEREEKEEQQRLLAQARRAELYAEGIAIKERKLADTKFMNSSAEERVAFWREFSERYPDVDVSEVYSSALAEREVDLAAQARLAEKDARLADLEARVQQAEARARRAEELATTREIVGYPVGTGRTYYYPSYAYPGRPHSMSTRTYKYTTKYPSYGYPSRGYVHGHGRYHGSYANTYCRPASFGTVSIRF